MSAVNDHPPHAVLDPWGSAAAYPEAVLCRSWDEVDHTVDLVIVFGRTPFWDDGELGRFLSALRSLRDNDATTIGVGFPAALTRLLEAAGFDRIVPVVESYEEAVELLRRSRG